MPEALPDFPADPALIPPVPAGAPALPALEVPAPPPVEPRVNEPSSVEPEHATAATRHARQDHGVAARIRHAYLVGAPATTPTRMTHHGELALP